MNPGKMWWASYQPGDLVRAKTSLKRWTAPKTKNSRGLIMEVISCNRGLCGWILKDQDGHKWMAFHKHIEAIFSF